MKLVAYIRVSTSGQIDGQGPEVQEHDIRAFAKANRHRIVSVVVDTLSGTNDLADRPALGDALELVRSRQADAIAVQKLDRLARDLVVQESILGDIWRMGADLFSAAPGESNLRDDPNDPSRALIRQVLGAVAQYDRSMIRLRLASGRRRKAEKGGYAYGSPAYGFRAVDGALVPDAGEQKVIARALELRSEGASLRTIAETLTAEGHRPKRGSVWHPPTVARMLESA